MNCNLCHRPFQNGDTVYHFSRGDGTPAQYHMVCFSETSQGSMGYLPERVTIQGEERLYIGLRRTE